MHRPCAYSLLGLLFVSALLHPSPVEAGIYDTDAEVTYKEYWVSHSEFTGGCGSHEVPDGGSWYLEPWPCTKTLAFEIPDDFSQALKVEIYLDLWRNHTEQSARFSLNGGPTHAPDVGYDWSRTPYIAEVPKSELQQGTNAITLWDAAGGYHVHDIAFRIHYDDGHPLLPGSGSDVTPPDGQLTSIVASNGAFSPAAGGTLTVDDDQVTLEATASGGDVKFVEFHAYYDGYDEDNDGEFLDWHNLGRNNFHPGGTSTKSYGGTIDHIGTDTSAPYEVTWNLPHIQNQSGVRFKIRVVDNAGNVREAAGGISADFTLSRDDTVETCVIPGFRDAVLHHGGTYSDIVTRFIDLPDDLSDVSQAHIIGAYWRNPYISVNGNPQFNAFVSGEDSWALSIREIPLSYLQPGRNEIEYTHNSGFGEFIEEPGPMIVLRRTPPPDDSPPFTYGHDPAPGATNVDPASNVSVHVADTGTGVATSTLTMTVAGTSVTPTITGDPSDYTLIYDPPVDFSPDEVVTVTVDGCDLHAPPHCMATEVYSFTVGMASPPVIDVWYGSTQEFGHVGTPQQWVNVLGNVSDPDGIASLVYSLNGSPSVPLSVGPDGRRLALEGDFNIDIDRTHPVDGSNQVVITATDNLGYTTVETVTVQYTDTNTWPQPYSIDWSTVTDIQDVAQVVDGKWAVEGDGVRPVEVGYDRLVAIGDLSWTDYEVTVPITIHDVDIEGSGGLSGNPGLGLLMRWTGHTDSPISGWQPKAGWEPYGAIGWWRWTSSTSATLQFHETGIGESFVPTLGVPYIFKMRVESTPGQGGFYRLKVWEDGQPEPSAWNLGYQADSSNLAEGSFMLLAHHVDASFGDVTVTPPPFPDTTPPVISDVYATPSETSATVTWTTDEPATSTVSYGQSAAYEDGGVGDNALVTAHTILLTGLVSDTLYHYQVTSADQSGNVASSTDLTFRTTSASQPDPAGIVSDDFNTCGLDTDLWTFVNPRDDFTPTMTGTFTADAWLSIAVESGTSHDIWEDGNFAPRIMQPANDADFEIVAKFESGVDRAYQMQGVLVEQDSDDFLRFGMFGDGSDTRLYAAIFEPGTSTPLDPDPRYNQPITDTGVAPLYMRVRRQGDEWTQSYSFDGMSWTTPVTFTHAVTVTAVGTYVGNAGSSPPAHTGYIDYFFNTASPIVPEDGDRNTLMVNVVGNGAVTTDPVKSSYDCGDVVTVTATADPGWTFAGWSGDLNGSDESVTVTMTGGRVITATFSHDEFTLRVNTVGSGRVTTEPVKSAYYYGDVVTLTAVADSGWTFAGWSGDLNGTEITATKTITGNTTVTATFTTYQRFLPFVVGTRLGVDTASPAVDDVQGIVARMDSQGPVIDVWYGRDQQFGHLGTPQNYVNVLGNVSDPDGVATLVYSLNGGPESALSIGPDDRRLASDGDFNVDMLCTDLVDGMNQVVITGTDALENQSVETVTFEYTSGSTWPLPYSVDWSAATSIQDVAQVVDGKWAIEGDSVRPIEIGYDRLVAIGDLAWTDYEVTVPITIHDVDFAIGPFSSGPGLGILMRWTGHTDVPVSGWQPKSGWIPYGAIGWWRWTSLTSARLQFHDTGVSQSFVPTLGVPYVFKMRVESTPGQGGLYRLKAWEAGQSEPSAWNLTYQADSSNLSHGSFLLLAHHVDASFGEVTVLPTGDITTTLMVSTVGSGTVAAEPDQSEYTYGQVVTLTAMPEVGWAFDHWSGDLVGDDNPAVLTMTADKVITATFTQDEYTVSVNTVGSGRVITEPVKPAYHYGDIVTFTARADPGWTFAGWSGDLTGADITATKTITGNTTVTATFAAQECTLTVNTVGGGSVDRDPDREIYLYGDAVTLTATADPAWTFAGWSGDLSGSDNPETFTVTGSIEVTATFTSCRIFLPLVTDRSTRTVHLAERGPVILGESRRLAPRGYGGLAVGAEAVVDAPELWVDPALVERGGWTGRTRRAGGALRAARVYGWRLL